LAAAVANKLEAGNFRAAIRIICSSDTLVEPNQDTPMKLTAKHPPPAADRRLPCNPADNPRFEPLQVSSDDVVRASRSFPVGSAGGPDGHSPQHIADLVAGATDDSLQQALVD